MTRQIPGLLSAAALCASLVCAQQQPQQQPTPEQKQQIEAAIPKKAPAKPKKARRLLVTNFAKVGDRVVRGHPAIPAGNYAIELMGKQTGAYDVVISNDPEHPRLDLSLTAKIRPLVQVSPGTMALVTVEDKPATQEFTLWAS